MRPRVTDGILGGCQASQGMLIPQPGATGAASQSYRATLDTQPCPGLLHLPKAPIPPPQFLLHLPKAPIPPPQFLLPAQQSPSPRIFSPPSFPASQGFCEAVKIPLFWKSRGMDLSPRWRCHSSSATTPGVALWCPLPSLVSPACSWMVRTRPQPPPLLPHSPSRCSLIFPQLVVSPGSPHRYLSSFTPRNPAGWNSVCSDS